MSKTPTYTSLVAGLTKVAADYHAGITLIDREFDEACQKFERSRHEYSQTTKLRHAADHIKLEMASIDTEIARLDQGLVAIDVSLQAIVQQKSSLEQQIQNRWLIERIIYLFVEDKDKQEWLKLKDDLDKQKTKKSTLEHTKQRFKTERLDRENRKKHLTAKLDDISRALNELNDVIKNTESRRLSRKNNLQRTLLTKWESAVNEIRQRVRSSRQYQPAFIDLKGGDKNIATEMPRFLLFGTQDISFKDFHCQIPHGIAFPFEKALFLPEDNEAQLRLAHHLLLRLLQAIPPGRLELTLIDPLKQGRSFTPFLRLLDVKLLMPQDRVLTRADEIEQALAKLNDEAEVLIQRKFKDRISNWSEFNFAHPDNPLRYKVVQMFDVPEQLSDNGLWRLERLIENGPRCGILPIIATDNQSLENRQFQSLRIALEKSAQRLDNCLNIKNNDKNDLSYTYLPEDWPQQGSLNDFLSTIIKRYMELAEFRKTLPDLWSDYTKGNTTANGFDIPVGWTPSGERVSLQLGATDSAHHALLAGKTGSGKSNLLHVIIHSLCKKYAPKELDLYLLDYKESTEFAIYANPSLPHARLVATESDPEYGVTVLQHLVKELEERAKRFKSAGVRDLAEYRKKHPNSLTPLPRILLVIDEFQVLFTEGRQTAEMSEKLLEQLLKQGRSFGIHLLLATQTLKGINVLSMSALTSQLGCRIALACTREDSAMILSMNNCDAATLKSPPEGIINNTNGEKSGNIKFMIPHAERTFCLDHLHRLSERAAKQGIERKTRVFNGAHLPQRPALDKYRDICGQGNMILIGEQLTFTADSLSILLTMRQGFNILFSGYDDLIHDGLLVSALVSMASSDAFDDIIYFNGRGVEPAGGYAEIPSLLGKRLKLISAIESLPLQEIADNLGQRRTALIIDGLDGEKALHPIQTFKIAQPGEPVAPSGLLKQIAEDGPQKGTFVFAFIDNWRRCASQCKDLLNLFEMRVGFCMNEDEAGMLIGDITKKFKGIEKPNRAVFVNRMTNEILWFRPYITVQEVDP